MVVTTVVPIHYTLKQASTDNNWLQDIKLKLNALENNHTCEIFPKPWKKHIVECKWLFKVKYLLNDCNNRNKARIVAKGFTQTYGLDYFETFGPVEKMSTVRLLVVIAAYQNWSIYQLDVTNAFLHRDIHEEIYMKLPLEYLQLPSFTSISFIINPNVYVCKLRKSLYGLKQAPRCWFKKFSFVLKDYGFTQSHSDNSLFTFTQGKKFVAILVYVDDILVTGTNVDLINTIKSYLALKF